MVPGVRHAGAVSAGVARTRAGVDSATIPDPRARPGAAIQVAAVTAAATAVAGVSGNQNALAVTPGLVTFSCAV